MRRNILILSSLIVMFIFLVSCAPQMTDEELEAELAKLTPEEREELLADLESKDRGALAGQAIAKKAYSTKVSPKVLKVSPALVKRAIARVCTPKTKAELCILDQTCGDIHDGCGGVVQCGNLCGDLKEPYCYFNKCRPEVFCEKEGVKNPYEQEYTKSVGNAWNGAIYEQEYRDYCQMDTWEIKEKGLENLVPGPIQNSNNYPVSFCKEEQTCVLVEHFCNGDNLVVEYLKCSNGCKDGACLPTVIQAETVIQKR